MCNKIVKFGNVIIEPEDEITFENFTVVNEGDASLIKGCMIILEYAKESIDKRIEEVRVAIDNGEDWGGKGTHNLTIVVDEGE